MKKFLIVLRFHQNLLIYEPLEKIPIESFQFYRLNKLIFFSVIYKLTLLTFLIHVNKKKLTLIDRNIICFNNFLSI